MMLDLMEQNEYNNDEDIESQVQMELKEDKEPQGQEGDILQKELEDFLNEVDDEDDFLSEESEVSLNTRTGVTVYSG